VGAHRERKMRMEEMPERSVRMTAHRISTSRCAKRRRLRGTTSSKMDSDVIAQCFNFSSCASFEIYSAQ
jgi:hypothetical protein